MLIRNLICPVSREKTDENVVRIIAFVVVIFISAGLLLESYLPFFIIAADFTLRAFTSGKYSFAKQIAKKAAGLFRLNKIPIDAAPKKFAARLGIAFSLIAGISFLAGNLILAYSAGIILLLCALLEGLFSFCVGCHVYTFILAVFDRQKTNAPVVPDKTLLHRK